MLHAQENEPVLEEADVLPKFKGDYFKFLQENINYPKEAANNNIQGTVYLEMIVNSVGEVSDIFIKKDIGGGCGAEAVRVLRSTNWEPASQDGKLVSVKMVVPVKFVLVSGREFRKMKRSKQIEKSENN